MHGKIKRDAAGVRLVTKTQHCFFYLLSGMPDTNVLLVQHASDDFFFFEQGCSFLYHTTPNSINIHVMIFSCFFLFQFKLARKKKKMVSNALLKYFLCR